MPRRERHAASGFVYHVLNRAVGRATLFDTPADYRAFEKVLREARDWLPVPLLSFCVMPNHWHLVLWLQKDGDLSEHMRWLTVTHTQRWHAHRRTAGTGPLYQGRFKSFPIQEDDHFLTVWRYVERNPLRAGLVNRAESWRWSSLYHREQGEGGPILDSWPVPRPGNRREYVRRPETEAELAALRRCLVRGASYGEEHWRKRTAVALGLQSSLHPLRRPRKVQR